MTRRRACNARHGTFDGTCATKEAVEAGTGRFCSESSYHCSAPPGAVKHSLAYSYVNRSCMAFFVWARRALNHQKWRFLARAGVTVSGTYVRSRSWPRSRPRAKTR